MLFPKLRRRSVRSQPTVQGVPTSMGGLRWHVLIRDEYCVLRKLGYPGHVCRGRFDSTPYHERDFTLEHVVGVHGVVDVRRDDDEHCVALDHATNVRHTTKAERAAIRKYLIARFPGCRGTL